MTRRDLTLVSYEKSALKTIVLLGCLFLVASSATAQDTNQAHALAQRTMEAMGGTEGLETIRYLRFDFQVEVDGNTVYVGRHLWDRKSGRYREEWELFGEQAQALFNVQTRDGRVYRGG